MEEAGPGDLTFVANARYHALLGATVAVQILAGVLAAAQHQDPTGPVRWDETRVSGQDALAVRVSKKLKGDEGMALTLLADILLNSAFGADELEREREVILQEIAGIEGFDDLVLDPSDTAPLVDRKSVV